MEAVASSEDVQKTSTLTSVKDKDSSYLEDKSR